MAADIERKFCAEEKKNYYNLTFNRNVRMFWRKHVTIRLRVEYRLCVHEIKWRQIFQTILYIIHGSMGDYILCVWKFSVVYRMIQDAIRRRHFEANILKNRPTRHGSITNFDE